MHSNKDTMQKPSDYVLRAVEDFMDRIRERHPNQPNFWQAVEEVARSVMPAVLSRPELREARILDRITEPDRALSFRVTWHDDDGRVRINRAWRVQFNGAIGPYKGGMRYHPGLTLDTLKFLGFEQTLKNSLTGLPMGGAKGGADFDVRAHSDLEVMRFCQSLMTELHHYIGPERDVPAGDQGVGEREIGYLFGQYRRLTGHFHGALTGKSPRYGGSPQRVEATGYGVVYFTQHVLAERDLELEGMSAVVSGAGNVALHCVEKLIEHGVRVLTVSDSDGFVYEPDGFTRERYEWLRDLKVERQGRVSEYADRFDSARYTPDAAPWSIETDLAFPCATENELGEADARELVENGVCAVAEGANMPCTPDAIRIFEQAGVAYAPGKAANAGGVAVSGLELTQNVTRMPWSREQVDRQLREIMREIHTRCVEHGRSDDGRIDYDTGANVAGFLRVADAMLSQGAI